MELEDLLEILKYVLPSLVVFITAYLLVKAKLTEDTARRIAEMKAANQKDLLPLQMQAYERLSVLLERTELTNLVSRNVLPGASASQLRQLLSDTVRAEFEHNLSQQVYVSYELWQAIRFVKDDTIKAVNLVARSLDDDAPAVELGTRLLEFAGSKEYQSSAKKGLAILHSEVKLLLA